MKPVCPYCQKDSRLVTGAVIYPHRPDLQYNNFWQCAPCDAYVGCHQPGIGYGDGTRPLGRLANAELRKAKWDTHKVFDSLWFGYTTKRDRQAARKKAYSELAKRMGISIDRCHIGEFDLDQCNQALAHAHKMIDEFRLWSGKASK